MSCPERKKKEEEVAGMDGMWCCGVFIRTNWGRGRGGGENRLKRWDTKNSPFTSTSAPWPSTSSTESSSVM